MQNVSSAAELAAQRDGKHCKLASCLLLACCFMLIVRRRLCVLGELTSVNALENALGDGDAALASSARAHCQDEVGVLIADHGAGVIWSIVGGGAS